MSDSESASHAAPGAEATVHAVVRAAPAEVFAAWTTPETMRRWGVATFVNEPGAGGHFRQETGSGDGVHVVSGEYREWVPGRRLVMTWDYTGPDTPPSHAVVTVDLEDDGAGGTRVTVTEAPVDPAVVRDAQAAWSGALAELDALLAPGHV